MPPSTSGAIRPPRAAARSPLPLRTLLRIATVVAAAACAGLVLACTILTFQLGTAVQSGRMGTGQAGRELHLDAYALGALGALLTVVVLTVSECVNRTIGQRVARARATAVAVAQHRIPDLARRLHEGEPSTATALPGPTGDSDEFGTLADALVRLARQASDSAHTVHLERSGFDQFATSTAARALVAAGSVLDGLDDLQRRPQLDEPTKAGLAALDEHTVQLRRQLENLLLLAGGTVPHAHSAPVRAGNLLLDAIGEVSDQDRDRVRKDFGAEGFIVPEAAGALTHLLAELIDNALAYSPPSLPVVVRSAATATGMSFEVEDRGIGLVPEALEQLNHRLQIAPLFAELAQTQQLGLFVAGRLAAQYEMSVRLQSSAYGGVRAVVHVPGRLLTVGAPVTASVPAPVPAASAPPEVLVIAGPGTRPALSVVLTPQAPRLTEDGLPQRVPGTSIAAPLRRRRPTGGRPASGYAVDERDPQHLADMYAHFPGEESR